MREKDKGCYEGNWLGFEGDYKAVFNFLQRLSKSEDKNTKWIVREDLVER